MLVAFLRGVKRSVLWDYPRATWQYDVMVAVILGFVFLTPRNWFRDQPRIPHSSNIAMLPSEQGSNVFWVEPELLDEVPEAQRTLRLGEILSVRTGKKQVVTRIETIFDAEKEIKGYMAFAKP
jgi:hypothetical protein